jgi:antitoxin ParD1/3/4
MQTVTISLPDSLKAFVEAEVATKEYGNVSEYFRTLLREAQDRDAKARLEGLLLEGLAAGESKAVDKTFWADLRAEAQRLVAERGATRTTRNKK